MMGNGGDKYFGMQKIRYIYLFFNGSVSFLPLAARSQARLKFQSGFGALHFISLCADDLH
jgi:hypothetical protein